MNLYLIIKNIFKNYYLILYYKEEYIMPFCHGDWGLGIG